MSSSSRPPSAEVLRLATIDALRTSLARVADLALAVAACAQSVAEGIDGADTPADLAGGAHELLVEAGELTREILNTVHDCADLNAVRK